MCRAWAGASRPLLLLVSALAHAFALRPSRAVRTVAVALLNLLPRARALVAQDRAPLLPTLSSLRLAPRRSLARAAEAQSSSAPTRSIPAHERRASCPRPNLVHGHSADARAAPAGWPCCPVSAPRSLAMASLAVRHEQLAAFTHTKRLFWFSSCTGIVSLVGVCVAVLRASPLALSLSFAGAELTLSLSLSQHGNSCAVRATGPPSPWSPPRPSSGSPSRSPPRARCSCADDCSARGGLCWCVAFERCLLVHTELTLSSRDRLPPPLTSPSPSTSSTRSLSSKMPGPRTGTSSLFLPCSHSCGRRETDSLARSSTSNPAWTADDCRTRSSQVILAFPLVRRASFTSSLRRADPETCRR